MLVAVSAGSVQPFSEGPFSGWKPPGFDSEADQQVRELRLAHAAVVTALRALYNNVYHYKRSIMLSLLRALENMQQGVVLLDADLQVLVCNARAAELLQAPKARSQSVAVR